MARKLKNNIIIICEGTDTEVGYLEDLAKVSSERNPELFSQIRIVPTPRELKTCEERNQKKKRKLKDSDEMAGWYYTKGEIEDEDFKKYRLQPTRYVREAQLYLLDGSFTQAWAVYDRDEFTDHKNARLLAEKQPQVNIAYSSVCFEEWILLHFEHNPKAFEKSVCKIDKKDIKCGTYRHQADCGGETCIGGRLRKMEYITNYAKRGQGLFSFLESRLEYARIGAAWTRSLNTNLNFWERNPYTDFDLLVNTLLGHSTSYIWKNQSSVFEAARTMIKVEGSILYNCGNVPFVGSISIYDSQFKQIKSITARVNTAENFTLPTGEYMSFNDKGKAYILRISCVQQ